MIKEQLKILIQLAVSDGMVAEKESRHIQSIAVANGISKEEVKAMIEHPEKVEEIGTLTQDQKFEYLYNVVQLMKVDGQVFKSEIAFAEDLAIKLGYKKGVIGELSSRIYSDPSITADKDELKRNVSKYLE
jgi:uncharacterized membrane protein YebE (DUF533 family)